MDLATADMALTAWANPDGTDFHATHSFIRSTRIESGYGHHAPSAPVVHSTTLASSDYRAAL